MRKLIVILVVLFVIFLPRIYWQFKEKTAIDMLIIDKTVPTTEYREHKGLFWFLKNEKIVKENGAFFDIGIDYYGYDPYEEKPMDTYKHEKVKDIIYIADTYGVYSDDLEDFVDGDRSERIYGGMDIVEWNEIMKSKGSNTTLIAEYNTFATPTEHSVRKVMEKNLNVEWTGWTGRYFIDLNSEEIPNWMIENYEKQYGEKWGFESGGIVFVHINDKILIVDEDELDSYVEFKLTEAGSKNFENVSNTNYNYWFDIVKPLNGAEVLARYELNMSEEAQNQLKQANIPLTFPAVTHHPQQKTYYFSGDFADYTKENMVRWYGGDRFMRIFSNEESNFQWVTYVPMMREIFAMHKAGK